MLKRELSAVMRGGSLPGGFAQLKALAARVIARTPQSGDASAVEELVATFLADLVEGKGVSPLLEGDSQALEAATRRRLRELAAETGPQWLLLKLLREHVGAVLDSLPEAPESLPLDLSEGGRFSTGRIAEACAWFLAQPGGPPRDRKALASALLKHYFSGEGFEAALASGAGFGHSDGQRPDELVRLQRDAAWMADRLVEHLGPLHSSVLMRHLAGQRLSDIAAQDKCALATAHARLEKARREIVPIMQACSSELTAGLALEVLAIRGARSVPLSPGEG